MDAYYGEIRMITTTYAPRYWAFCNGGYLPISQNEALYSVIGTRFGGNGTNNFQLPDLRDKVPMHYGDGPGLTERVFANDYGHNTITITSSQMPSHTHQMIATSDDGITDIDVSSEDLLARTAKIGKKAKIQIPFYTTETTDETKLVNMASDAISDVGGGQSHENRQPYLAVNFFICVVGENYPTRN